MSLFPYSINCSVIMSEFKKTQYNEKRQWNHNFCPQGNYLQNKHSPKPAWTTPFLELDYKFWCETCDKGFKIQAHLEYHKKLHQKCNIDGCQYVAHPAVITKHIQMQHATGLFKRMGRLHNPEEIKKWREDRKKRYPTKANIEKKQAEIKEKIRRGEKLGINQAKRVKSDKQGPHNKGKRKISHLRNQVVFNNGKKDSNFPDIPQPIKKICNIIPTMEENRKLQRFKGIQYLISEENTPETVPQLDNGLIEDEEDTACIESNISSEPTLCGAITSLMFDYGSSGSDEDDSDKNPNNTYKEICKIDNNIKTNIENHGKKDIEKDNNKICNDDLKHLGKESFMEKLSQDAVKNTDNLEEHNVSEDDTGPEETSIAKEDTSGTKMEIQNKIKKEKLKKHRPEQKRNIVKLRRKLPSTLLEKLLHKEIQHERNVILQCVRYVVENQYFDEH